MANIRFFGTEGIPIANIGQAVDDMMQFSKDSRKPFERRWYDNNFFDDGHHFRYLSRQQNKIIDLSERQNIYTPLRAIPKASRQIRGVANLLLSSEPTPVIYPEKVNKTAYPSIQQQDPTGQIVSKPNPEYALALKEAKRIAKLSGHWLEEELRKQELMEKLALMCILTAKHSISFMEIWPDNEKEAIRTQIYDAFDIYLVNTVTNIYDSPYLGKGVPMFISEIKANEDFEEEQRAKINPDNKSASSEIKEAYMNQRYGRSSVSEHAATLILKEFLIKEHLSDQNWSRAIKDADNSGAMEGKNKGDIIIRQAFVAGNIGLKDKYIKFLEYPYVDLRFEPGPIYGVPMIERFIPLNKSLDMAVSRLERFLHTMVSGAWIQAASEGDLQINNAAGGQVIKYKAIPPTPAPVASPGGAIFSFMQLLTSLIEEQGVTTSTLGKVPSGVKANAAIESLKESEYANLIIASRMLKGTVKRIAQRFLDLADDYFITPQTVYFLEKGEPQYFDIIGNTALKKRKNLKIDEKPLDAIPLKKEYRVEIEISSGMAYTREGKKSSMQGLIAELREFAMQGFIPPQAVKIIIEKYLETYQFGAVSEFMEAMEDFQGQGNMTDQQLQAMKIAIGEVMQDMQKGGVLPTSQQRVDETKIGIAEVMQDMKNKTGGIRNE